MTTARRLAQQQAASNVNKAIANRDAEAIGNKIDAAVQKRAGRESSPAMGQVAREAVGGWFRQGIQNFRENAGRSSIRDPEREPRERRGRGRAPSRREPEPMFNIPRDDGFALNFDALGPGLNMDLHPDPMYRGPSRGGSKGARRVVRTTTYFED